MKKYDESFTPDQHQMFSEPKQRPRTAAPFTDTTPEKKRKPVTTSAAQLQVYLKPEYVDFTRTLNPRNPNTIRPKRMNLQQTLRLTEDIYSFRFAQKAASKAN